MARMLKRDANEAAPQDAPETNKEATPAEATPEPVNTPTAAAAPIEKPLDISFQMSGRVEAASIRVVGQYIIFNEGVRMRRAEIIKGAPITITLRQ